MSTGAPAAAPATTPAAPTTNRDWQKTLLVDPVKAIGRGIAWISKGIWSRVTGVMSETWNTATSPITKPLSAVSSKVASRLGYTGLEQGNIFDKVAMIVEQTLEKVNKVLQTTANIALDIGTGIPAGVAGEIIRAPNNLVQIPKALIFGKKAAGGASSAPAAAATPPPADTAAPAAAH